MPQGNTPLMYSCAGGHHECSSVLLEYGASPCVKSDADLDTPLHKAVRWPGRRPAGGGGGVPPPPRRDCVRCARARDCLRARP